MSTAAPNLSVMAAVRLLASLVRQNPTNTTTFVKCSCATNNPQQRRGLCQMLRSDVGLFVRELAAPRRGAAGVALAAGAAADECELSAFGAGIAFVAFQFGLANLFLGE